MRSDVRCQTDDLAEAREFPVGLRRGLDLGGDGQGYQPLTGVGEWGAWKGFWGNRSYVTNMKIFSALFAIFLASFRDGGYYSRCNPKFHQ